MAALSLSEHMRLRELIWKEQSKTSFACGGTIPIHADESNQSTPWKTTPDKPMFSRPVSVFWSPRGKSEVHLVELPGDNASVEKLAADCSPASFGRGGEDVLDESYRRAGKLDLKEFATSFHPADLGLVRNIEKVLLPSIMSAKDNELQFRGLVADLYKLNVYFGPSGHFKAHVDTPRSDTQVGSLVVCLPSEFKGGNLLVRHGKEEINFDWSLASKSTIQWAAFYSDCEHEIKEVTDGHRITLTYNLHVVDLAGGTVLPKSIDPETLPLFEVAQSLLKEPKLAGTRLGIYCAHAYAHTSSDANKRLPRCLKGSDLVIYSVFEQLGCDVEVLPVIPEQEFIGDYLYPQFDEYDTPDGDPGFGSTEQALEQWPRIDDGCPTIFLNGPNHEEKAMSYMHYGNESTVEWVYSAAAIIVETPEKC